MSNPYTQAEMVEDLQDAYDVAFENDNDAAMCDVAEKISNVIAGTYLDYCASIKNGDYGWALRQAHQLRLIYKCSYLVQTGQLAYEIDLIVNKGWTH